MPSKHDPTAGLIAIVLRQLEFIAVADGGYRPHRSVTFCTGADSFSARHHFEDRRSHRQSGDDRILCQRAESDRATFQKALRSRPSPDDQRRDHVASRIRCFHSQPFDSHDCLACLSG